MRLSEQIITLFRNELFDLKRVSFKDIYHVKSITNRIGTDILFSCRFKTPNHHTYIASIKITLIDKEPHARISIHELCDRRWFSRTIAYQKTTIPDELHLRNLKKDKEAMLYYQKRSHFRYSVMGHIFVRNKMKDFLVKYVDLLEELK